MEDSEVLWAIDHAMDHMLIPFATFHTTRISRIQNQVVVVSTRDLISCNWMYSWLSLTY